MPWCAGCDRHLADDELVGDGRCPACSGVVEAAPVTPWHFKLLVVAIVLYLGWRAVQGVGWLVAHL